MTGLQIPTIFFISDFEFKNSIAKGPLLPLTVTAVAFNY
jgi:hypothetical protein